MRELRRDLVSCVAIGTVNIAHVAKPAAVARFAQRESRRGRDVAAGDVVEQLGVEHAEFFRRFAVALLERFGQLVERVVVDRR